MKIQTSRQFLAKLAARRHSRALRSMTLSSIMAAAMFAASSAQAANVSHTIVGGATGNVSDPTQYTAGGAPGAGTAGDILQDTAVTSPGAFTLSVDIPVVIGTIKLNAGGAHSGVLDVGAGFLTLDNTGGTVTNSFGNTNASIGQFANAGTLTINANVVAANANLDIGSTQAGNTVIAGNITASTATSLNLRNNTAQTSGTTTDSISGSTGATGSAIAINNVSGGNARGVISLTGAIGGAAGTGAAVTINNLATGASPFNISGALGSSIQGITQNSATSTMAITSGTSAFAGPTSIQNGTLSLGSAVALSQSAVTLANTAGATLNVSAASTVGSLSGGGTTGGNVTLAATLTTGALNANPTYSGTLSGTGGLTKVGTGTLTLNGTNTYTGATAVNNGTLNLDFTGATAPVSNILGNTTAAGLNMGGGRLNIVGAAAGSTQTFATTAITSGGNVIAAAPTTGGVLPTVNLGTLTGTQGALVRFNGPASESGASSGTTTGTGTPIAATATFNATTNAVTSGLISNTTAVGSTSAGAGSYATVGLYDWAAISTGTSGTAQTGSIVGGSQIAGFYTTTNVLTTGAASPNLDLTASGIFGANSTSLSSAYSTIRFNTPAAITLTTGRALSENVVGGLLLTPNIGSNNITIAAQAGANNQGFQASRSTTGATGLTVWQNNTAGELIVNASYNNGSNSAANASYTQGGPGSVFLNGVNAYTGVTNLDGGTTVLNANSGIGAVATGAAVNLNGGQVLANASFALDNAGLNLRQINLNGAGGTLAATTGNTLTVNGFIGGVGTLTVGSGTLAGTGAGTANTTAINGNGTVILTGANGYSGGTNVNAGTLNINGLFALGGANYSGTTFNGGTLQYALGTGGAFSTTAGGGDISNFGGAKTVTINAGGATIDTNNNNVTFASPIGNGGTGSLTKTGLGVLTFAAANTYTGVTFINAGGLALSTGSVASNAITLTGTGSLTLNNSTALPDSSVLSLATGTALNLDGTTGTSETVGSLVLNGTVEPAGTYTAAQLAALTGATGVTFESLNGETLTVSAVPEPSTWAMMIAGLSGLGAMALFRRSRA